jgi:hypothetical protein
MPTAVHNLSPSLETSERLPKTLRAFVDLAAMVRTYQPEVVVLVARKVPHLASRLSLRFGDSCLVISDLAIPFAHALLRGARVAVIDDMVNVGSTLNRVCKLVRECGAANVAAFSVGRRANSLPQTEEVIYVLSEPLGDDAYDEHTRAVPRFISELARPYDLAFPVLTCRLQPGFGEADHFRDWLMEKHGADHVEDLSSSHAPATVRRFSVDLECASGMGKIRLFVDEETGNCNVVPFAIPSVLVDSAWMPRSRWASAVYECLAGSLHDTPPTVELWPGEAKTRAAMFCHALDFGLRALETWGDALVAQTPEAFSVDDAAMVFGPVILSIWRSDSDLPPPLDLEVRRSVRKLIPSPFARNFPVSALVSRVRERLPACAAVRDSDNEPKATDLDFYNAFNLLFDELAKQVGAEQPEENRLVWPYARTELDANPYLRLRIGPTFDDLVQLLLAILRPNDPAESIDLSAFCHRVSALLDLGVDAGSVVPTIARYEGQFYRIYRRGEGPSVDVYVDRICFAVQCHEKPMSLTRIAKIDAILALTNAYGGTTIARALKRGNTGALPAGILDDPYAEAAEYARNIGRLKAVENESKT